jgi:hypothetical protein
VLRQGRQAHSKTSNVGPGRALGLWDLGLAAIDPECRLYESIESRDSALSFVLIFSVLGSSVYLDVGVGQTGPSL